MGIDYAGPTTSDVHILANSTESLFSGPLTSYKLPLSFLLRVQLSPGDTIDFAVGFGANSNYFYDGSAIAVQIVHTDVTCTAQAPPECIPGTNCFNAVKDFSITSNPNGVWQYGWTASLGSEFNLYGDTDSASVPGMSAWLAEGTFSNPPSLAHNDTPGAVCWLAICDPPTFLYSHPGAIDQYTVLRWVAPAAGVYRVRAVFMGLDHATPVTTDVHVLVNSTKSLFSGPITSTDLPLDVFLNAQASAGDTVDFAVGFGADGNYNSDSTGIAVQIVQTNVVCAPQ